MAKPDHEKIRRALIRAGLTPEEEDWIYQDDNAERVVKSIRKLFVPSPTKIELKIEFEKPVPAPPASSPEQKTILFSSPKLQAKAFYLLNAALNLGISDEELKKIPRPPKIPPGLLQTVVLSYGFNSVQRTAELAWQAVCYVFEKRRLSHLKNNAIQFTTDQFRMIEGATYPAGFCWTKLDLGCGINQEPEKIREAQTSPGIELLWLAALCPNWISAMDGKRVPFVWLPNIILDPSQGNKWRHVPALCWSKKDYRVELTCSRSDYYYPGWAIPRRIVDQS